MNILILNWRDPKHPLAGGAEYSLNQHAKYWIKKGANVTWVASSFRNAKKEEIIENIKIIRMGNHYTVHLSFMTNWLLGKVPRNFNIIIDCFHFLPFFSPLFINKIRKIALINEVAGSLWFSNLPFPFSWIGYKLEPLFFKFYKNTLFITASKSAKRDLLKIGIKARQINVVHHGITFHKVNNKIRKEINPTILYLGRISKDKGVEDAIKVIDKLKNNYKNITLWVIGRFESETYRQFIMSYINKLDIKKNIKFLGFVNDTKKAELLKKAWFLVHPSIKEGWGLNVIEANSLGTPAVGYRVEGLVDSIVDKKTGILVNPNPNSMATAARKLIDDKKSIKSMGLRAVEWSKNFSWKKAGEDSWKILNL